MLPGGRFQALDTDGNGTLSRQELMEGFAKGGTSIQGFELAAMDTDESGDVSYAGQGSSAALAGAWARRQARANEGNG